MTEAIDNLRSNGTFRSGMATAVTGRTRARQVLAELDRRYEPAPWRLQVRRFRVVIAALALVVIAIAGTGAILASRRDAG